MRHISVSVHAAAVLLLAATATLLAAAPAAADPASDFTFTYSGSTATITDFVGSNTAVDIPATVTDSGTTYTVTAIGDNAFRGDGLTTVTIPDSVTAVGDNAFRGDLLTAVVIPNSVTSIGTYAFYNNALTSVVIPDSITAIANNAFRGNALTSVTIPNSVTSLGNNSFADNALTTLTIPSSVTSIGAGTFGGSNALTSVIFAGNAPLPFTAAGATGSLGTGAGLTVYYYAGASGFASPSWNLYNTLAISAAESDLTLTPSGPLTVGSAPYTVTVTVRDSTHAPVVGVPVSFGVPAGVTASAASCVTATGGTCDITLMSALAATYRITAMIGADPAVISQNITFAAVPATTAGGDPSSGLAETGLNAVVPLTLAGGLFAVGSVLLALAFVRRRKAL